MNAVELQARSEIVTVSQALDAAGLVPNKSGNVSCRRPDGFLITPAGVPYRDLSAERIVPLALDCATEPGDLRPSSEWRMHAAIYARRPDVHAIVHTHSPRATALACAGRGIPPFHYMIARAGGRDIRCAPYATFGTQELSDHAVRALEGRRACLLAHHGMIAVGASLESTLELAIEVETLAEMYWRALQVGEPELLSDAEMAKVLEKFRTYGQPCRAG